AGFEFDSFLGIHLPDLVGGLGPTRIRRGPPPSGRRPPAGLMKPALQGPLTRKRLPPPPPPEHNPAQTGSPGGVVLAQRQRFLPSFVPRVRRSHRAMAVARGDGASAP